MIAAKMVFVRFGEQSTNLERQLSPCVANDIGEPVVRAIGARTSPSQKSCFMDCIVYLYTPFSPTLERTHSHDLRVKMFE